MKKEKSFFSVVLLFISLNIFAQVNIGVEAGPNLSFMRGSDFIKENIDPLIAFSAGLTFQYNAGDVISVRTGISYERKGGSAKNVVVVSGGTGTSKEKVHINFNYITLPLLVRASFGDNVRFFVNAGPYFSYLLSQVVVDPSKQKYEFTDDYKKLDIGASGGLGVSIPFGEQLAFSIEVRNNLGLTDVHDIPANNSLPIKHNCTNLLLGLTYQIGN